MQPPTEEMHLWAAELLACFACPHVANGEHPQMGWLRHCPLTVRAVVTFLLQTQHLSHSAPGMTAMKKFVFSMQNRSSRLASSLNALFRNMAASLPTQSSNAAWRQLCSQVSLCCNIRACSSSLGKEEKASPYRTKKNHMGESGKQTYR